MPAPSRRVMTELLVAGVLVPVSSWLGLARLDWNAEGWRFFVNVWSASAASDVLFSVGSIGAFFVALRAAARAGPLVGAIASGILNVAVYLLSYLSLPEVEDTTGQALELVLDWGVYGLVFCTFAVPVAWFLLRRADRAGAAPNAMTDPPPREGP